MHRPEIFHPLQTESPRQGCIAPRFFIPTDRISSAGMHRPRIFHPCRQNLLVRDASPRDFSSLQTESPRQGCIATGFSSLQTEFPRQGCIATGFFIPADRIFSEGMHRPGIFHPCRQNLLGRDCIAPRFFIPADRISSLGMHRLRKYAPSFRAPPQSAELTSIHLNACRAYPDKAGSSDFQTAGFHSR